MDYTNQQKWKQNCKGNSQSPIDFQQKISKKANGTDPLDAANFVSTNFKGNFKTKFKGKTFNFIPEIGDANLKCSQLQCHFNTAEHAVNGNKYFGECHVFCHKRSYKKALKSNKKGAITVFAFFIETSQNGNDDAVIQQIIDAKDNFSKKTIAKTISIGIPVPKNLEKGYFRYDGSLTAPPCNEIVTWTVFSETVKISMKQKAEIESWPKGVLNGNNREVQQISGRVVEYYGSPFGTSEITMKAIIAWVLVVIFVGYLVFLVLKWKENTKGEGCKLSLCKVF